MTQVIMSWKGILVLKTTMAIDEKYEPEKTLMWKSKGNPFTGYRLCQHDELGLFLIYS